MLTCQRLYVSSEVAFSCKNHMISQQLIRSLIQGGPLLLYVVYSEIITINWCKSGVFLCKFGVMKKM